MSKLLLTTVAVLALAGAAHAAPVAADNDTPTRAISTEGVNFGDVAQVRHFYFKLQTAVRAVCDTGSADRIVSAQDISCIRENMRAAVGKVGAPQLTAMLNTSYGVSGARASAFATDAR